MIEKLSLRLLPSKALLHYSTTFVKIMQEAQIKEKSIIALMDRLETSTTHLQERMNKAGKQSLSAQIAEADENQDLIFVELRDSVKLEQTKFRKLRHPQSALVMEAIRQAGYSLHNFSYKNQEEAMTQLLETFEQDEEVKAALSFMKMDALVKELNDNFTEFKRLREAKREEDLGKAEDKSLIVVRKEISELVDYIIYGINHELYADKKAAVFSELAPKLNELNSYYRVQGKSQATRRANENDEDYGAEFNGDENPEEE